MPTIDSRMKQWLRDTLYLYALGRTPTCVFAIGHVGSIALTAALAQRHHFVFKAETLDPVKLKQNTHLTAARWFHQHVVLKGCRAKIISITRDPLALMISEFFSKSKHIAGRRDAATALPVETLIEMFLHDYVDQKRHLRVLHWFDHEMKPALGIDVYQRPSPAGEGSAQWSESAYDVLLVRTELDDAQKSQVVGAFVGIPDLEIQRVNTSGARPYREQYSKFKDSLHVPDDLLDTIYNSTYARHFYTDDEREAMRSRWRSAGPSKRK